MADALHTLAEDLDRDVHLVVTRLDQLRRRGVDLPPRKPRWTPEARERLARRYREGATYRQLCNEFERAHGTISRQLRYLREGGARLPRDDAP